MGTMKQSTSSSTHTSNFLSLSFDDGELQVADILLSLPNLIHESEYGVPAGWGSKRRRSIIDLTRSPTRRVCPSPSPSPSLHRTNEAERRPKAKAEASSPATPLSFSPSESDEVSKHSRKKISKKRTREEWLEIVEELNQRRELLRREVETVRAYYDKLKATNMSLKAKKQELSVCVGKPPRLEITDPQSHFMVHQQQYILGQNFQHPYGQMSWVGQMGPLCGGIPDLNVSAEETVGVVGVGSSQPLDHNRASTENNKAKAAEARRRRMIRIKEMKNSSATTIKPLPSANVKRPRC